MIDYDTGEWGVGFIFQLRGTVYMKTLLWAVPSTVAAILIHVYFREEVESAEGVNAGIQMGTLAYTTVLSFLLVFRTQQAYARWWEGGTLLQTLRGEWFNAYSNLLSFTSRDPAHFDEVERFQHLLVRLMSLLHAAAMEQVSTTDRTTFEIIELTGFDLSHLQFLQNSEAKCEVILQWIQRIVVQAMSTDTLPIPAPILSRVFQELSRGIVNLANARKISEFMFPFPYAQMITVTLIIHWIMMPFLMGIYCSEWWVAGFLTFITVTSLWSINYVAQEIESPFGADDNDLPLVEMQMSFNRNLVSLMMREAQEAPVFNLPSQESSQPRHLFDAITTARNSSIEVSHITSGISTIQDIPVNDKPPDATPGQPGLRPKRNSDSEKSMYSQSDQRFPLQFQGLGKRPSAYTMGSMQRYERKLRATCSQQDGSVCRPEESDGEERRAVSEFSAVDIERESEQRPQRVESEHRPPRVTISSRLVTSGLVPPRRPSRLQYQAGPVSGGRNTRAPRDTHHSI